MTQAHLQIKEFLGRGPADAYTRFIAPDDFKALTKYDVTGVGLNLGTAEEYVAKAQRPLPPGRGADGGGVWVVGLIKVRTRILLRSWRSRDTRRCCDVVTRCACACQHLDRNTCRG